MTAPALTELEKARREVQAFFCDHVHPDRCDCRLAIDRLVAAAQEAGPDFCPKCGGLFNLRPGCPHPEYAPVAAARLAGRLEQAEISYKLTGYGDKKAWISDKFKEERDRLRAELAAAGKD